MCCPLLGHVIYFAHMLVIVDMSGLVDNDNQFKDEKKLLFPTESTTSGVIHSLQMNTSEPAIINAFCGHNDTTRSSVDMLCPGCSKYGHSVFHNSCDFCASFLLASNFFKKYPNSSTKILECLKEHHQLKRKKEN
jgi:hypothetical protein